MASGEELRQLVLHESHVKAGARFAPFAGWEMPLQYSGIIAEHEAVRTRAGVFDVSHLGRCYVSGPGAMGRLIYPPLRNYIDLRSITTYNVDAMSPGTAHYSLYCNDAGGIDDDVFIYRLGDEDWLVVHNAANAEADFARVEAAFGNEARDRTDETVMLAVQGPDALQILSRVIDPAVAELAEHHWQTFAWAGGAVTLARTGYTGEDGGECIVEASLAERLWNDLLAAGAVPAGLGARDTLRLEAALPLHGHDIDASTNPFEAGLGWAVSLKDDQAFTGREALVRLKARPQERKLACLIASDRGVLRSGYPVLDEAGERLGTLTSGGFGPTVRKGIGMAYLPAAVAVPGTRLAVEVRGTPVAAEVVPRPFYRRS